MKFMIGDKIYDPEEAIKKVSLSDLYVLKTKNGIGMKTLQYMAQNFEKFADPFELLDDKEAFRAFMVIIWLTRRHAGEQVSLDEASNFPLYEFRMVLDEPEPEQDPKALPASDPAGSAPAAGAST